MKKNILVNPDKCDGCCTCMLACSFAKENEFSTSKARIHIVKIAEKGLDLPVTCKHCIKARCMEACVFNAIKRDEETGIVLVEQEACTGCGSCVTACPFGAITIHPEKGTALLCDLCGGDPECVKFCVTGAIKFGALNTLAGTKRSKFGESMCSRG